MCMKLSLAGSSETTFVLDVKKNMMCCCAQIKCWPVLCKVVDFLEKNAQSFRKFSVTLQLLLLLQSCTKHPSLQSCCLFFIAATSTAQARRTTQSTQPRQCVAVVKKTSLCAHLHCTESIAGGVPLLCCLLQSVASLVWHWKLFSFRTPASNQEKLQLFRLSSQLAQETTNIVAANWNHLSCKQSCLDCTWLWAWQEATAAKSSTNFMFWLCSVMTRVSAASFTLVQRLFFQLDLQQLDFWSEDDCRKINEVSLF